MSTFVILLAFALYILFYFTYGKRLDSRLIQSAKAPAPPSHQRYDGVDYVPTNKYVLFGHHFASIAGAGPIVGPAIAIAWGWLPGLLWIWIGNIFIGAIHDYLSLMASVRYDGRSVQFISQDLISKRAGKSFGWFILFLCILIVGAFGSIVAVLFEQNGSLATTFLFFIGSALILGFLLYRTKIPFLVSSLIGIALLIGSFWLGSITSIHLSQDYWFPIILVYIVIAASLPVSVLLQPRDYLNSYLLYFGLVIGLIAAIISFQGFDAVPAFTSFSAPIIGNQPTPIWPAIPLIIACGALSGFHSLVSSGTSSKQLKTEKDGLFIGYGSMLTEGFLATLVIVAIAGFGVGFLDLDPIQRFTKSFGVMVNSALPLFTRDFIALFAGIWISAFALTTLDTTNRLGRYIVSELALPLKDKYRNVYQGLSNKWVGSLVVAGLGILLAWTGSYTVLWPAFSGANQLIASVVMITLAVWVKKRLNERYTYLVLIPAGLLWITVTASLIWYEITIIPTHFLPDSDSKAMITGILVGVMTLIMLIINFIIMVAFFRNFNKPYTGNRTSHDMPPNPNI